MSRLEIWKMWRRKSIGSLWYRLKVLFGLVHSPTFDMEINYYNFWNRR